MTSSEVASIIVHLYSLQLGQLFPFHVQIPTNNPDWAFSCPRSNMQAVWQLDILRPVVWRQGYTVLLETTSNLTQSVMYLGAGEGRGDCGCYGRLKRTTRGGRRKEKGGCVAQVASLVQGHFRMISVVSRHIQRLLLHSLGVEQGLARMLRRVTDHIAQRSRACIDDKRENEIQFSKCSSPSLVSFINYWIGYMWRAGSCCCLKQDY